MSQPNPGKFPAVASYGNEINTVSPHDSISQSPMLGSFGQACSNGYGEVQRLRDELTANKLKLQHWEESIAQARNVSFMFIRFLIVAIGRFFKTNFNTKLNII